MSFQKATKSKSKLRCAIFGPSGAGKTFSALSIATGIGGKIAVIDSERGSASKYADRFSFDVVELQSKRIDDYVQFIHEAGAAGYNVLIVDSLSHAWQELLEDMDKLAQAKYRGNTWSAWSEGTPKQKKLVEAIVSCPCHIIATMRSKTEWQTSQNDKGKSTPIRVGLAPEQGKGIEYEFDLLLEMNPEHTANIIKDRTGKFQDKIIDKPGLAFGADLIAWLNVGAESAPVSPSAPAPTTAGYVTPPVANSLPPATDPAKAKCIALAAELHISKEVFRGMYDANGKDWGKTLAELEDRKQKIAEMAARGMPEFDEPPFEAERKTE